MADEPDDDANDSTRRMDSEILVIQQIARKLADLDEDARQRVVAYLHSRFARRKET